MDQQSTGQVTRSGVALASMIALEHAVDGYQDGRISGEELLQRRLAQEPAVLRQRHDGNDLLASQGFILLADIDLLLMSTDPRFQDGNSADARATSPSAQTTQARKSRAQTKTTRRSLAAYDSEQIRSSRTRTLHAEVELDAPSLAAVERLEEQLTTLEKRTLARGKKSRSWTVRWPVDNPVVTSPFGLRKDPINGKRKKHRGADFRGAEGDPVYAAGPGEVLLAGWGGKGTGNAIVIRHAGNVVTQYFHLSKVHVRAGETVKSGDKIGAIGSTGRATGPHLHFMFSKHGEAMDPIPWIEKTIKVK